MTILKAFISYKWEDTAHNQWVQQFATDLRSNGIEAILDQWEVRLGDSFTDYMTSKIRDADVVLFIMTTRSVTAVEAPLGEGGAVKFELQMATARRTAGENMRLIGIYREGDKTAAHLQDHRYADFRDDDHYEMNTKVLVDDLLGRISAPPLGNQLQYSDRPHRITLPVTVRIPSLNCSSTVRALMNSASARSYIDRDFAAHELRLPHRAGMVHAIVRLNSVNYGVDFIIEDRVDPNSDPLTRCDVELGMDLIGRLEITLDHGQLVIVSP